MGYLDSSTITVDAVLTKKGREVLASGGSLNISKYAFSDDGVDYTLWNTAHPSGSANYGEAIENLPNLEAVTENGILMRYKLWTSNANTVFMPYIERETGTGAALTIVDQNDVAKFSIKTRNGKDTSYLLRYDNTFGYVVGAS